TRLTTREILSGKFFASLLPTLVALTVLFPPFALMLIVQNVNWAMDPGPWMLVVGLKFLVSAVFYIAVFLVCSYHCSTTRTALAGGYVLLGLYGMLNYAFWMLYFLPTFVFPPRSNSMNVFHHHYSSNPTLPWEVSTQQFSLSPVEWLFLAQSALFGLLLFTY